MGRDIDLSQLDIRTALKIMMAENNVNSFADIARNLEIKETTFRSAVSNGSIRLEDFMKVAKSMGYTVVLKPQEK